MVRACFGFSWTDESFYLTFVHRLLQGDHLILNEWHPAQFYSVMLLPAMWLYRNLIGVTGIYLFFRQLCLLAAFGTALVTYRVFRKQISPAAAFFCACAYLLYSKSNVWGASYYNIFLTCMLLSLDAVLTALSRGAEGGKRFWFLNGLLVAGAVLCMPYFAAFVLAGLLLCLLFLKKYRQGVLLTLLGSGTAALLFLAAFLRDIPAVISALPYVLSDGEHQSGALQNLIGAIREMLQLFRLEILLSLLSSVLLCLGEKSARRQLCRVLCGGILTAAVCAMYVKFLREVPGYAYYALAIAGFPLMVLSYFRKEVHPVGIYIRAVGICMALSFAMGSNTLSNAMTMGVTVYLIGVLFQLFRCPVTLSRSGHGMQTAVTLLMAAALVFTLFSRVTLVNRDGNLGELNTRIASGPAAGLRTTPEHAAVYESLTEMFAQLSETYSDDNCIFITKVLPWGYMTSDFRYGTPTAWRTALSSTRLEAYYSLYPQKLPRIVVVLNDTVGNYAGAPTPNENPRTGFLWEYMQENGYLAETWPQATVYIAPDALRR